MTAWEAYDAYGLEVIEEAKERGAAILLASPGAAERSIRARRDELGLTQTTVAGAAKVDLLDIERAETPGQQASIALLEKVAVVLGLDERLLAFDPTTGADYELAARLRTMHGNVGPGTEFDERTVVHLAEAGWVISTQDRLRDWLLPPGSWPGFDQSADYGSREQPAWRVGYELASTARRRLGLGNEPIASLRKVVEETLGIPVVQIALPPAIAGATVAVKERRGVVLNTVGMHSNVWVRRFTLAHELGHLLFDPAQRLLSVRVDSFEALHLSPDQVRDEVEQRANAFAIAFLAPPDGVRGIVGPPETTRELTIDDLRKVITTYGISATAGRYHVENSYWRSHKIPNGRIEEWPADDQQAAEDWSLDYFIPRATPPSRRGRIAGLVVAAVDRGLISDDTATRYLSCSIEEYHNAAETIRELFPVATQ
jgi:Zn-dependent peptidase ImmA (M78 family)/transcriptional regulator with XRE-family HTH domain